MTTKENKAALKAKVEKQLKDFTDYILSEGGKLDRLMLSGALDLSEPEEGFVTSSQIMCALGRLMEDQYTPSGNQRDHKREVQNISNFL